MRDRVRVRVRVRDRDRVRVSEGDGEDLVANLWHTWSTAPGGGHTPTLILALALTMNLALKPALTSGKHRAAAPRGECTRCRPGPSTA